MVEVRLAWKELVICSICRIISGRKEAQKAQESELADALFL